ncbi:DMT family transporter [Pseudonocardia broussonetiae]|uniref:QacE family quaternary ammonium compound efflux SMR transporter n=1 Tax=Pseudonocardia broussonetiae TaxID=2736640 RepID=A0A6M6JKV8_9PSEU|nr:SMR family transporter [Pseudonocardia broussonetiae]QJY48784.1 QacE family quaternary ammonium compound efflux SMR transporter [Pseudonocardia broussonetiae]
MATAAGPLGAPTTTRRARSPWWPMAGAIAAEICSTLLLKASDGFAHPLVGAAALLGFTLTLVLLSRALLTLPLGVAYAVWVGVGSVVVTLGGVLLFGDRLSAGGIAGIALVALGVVVVNR